MSDIKKRAYTKEIYEKNKIYYKGYYIKNKKHIMERQLNYNKKNKEKIQEYNRKYWLRRKHNLKKGEEIVYLKIDHLKIAVPFE